MAEHEYNAETCKDHPEGICILPLTDDQRADLIERCRRALHHAFSDEVQLCADQLTGISDTYFDHGGIEFAVFAAVDTFAAMVGVDEITAPDSFAFLTPEADGLAMVDVERVDPYQLWAARVATARMRGDEQAFRALWAAPETNDDFGRSVLALYMLIGGNMRQVVQGGFRPIQRVAANAPMFPQN